MAFFLFEDSAAEEEPVFFAFAADLQHLGLSFAPDRDQIALVHGRISALRDGVVEGHQPCGDGLLHLGAGQAEMLAATASRRMDFTVNSRSFISTLGAGT